MRAYATGYDLALAIDPASYHIDRDAEGRAYAFDLGRETAEQLAECVRWVAPTPGAIDDFSAAPSHVRLKVDPTTSGRPEPVSDWDAVLGSAVDRWNDRHADHPAEELQTGAAFIGFYRLDGAPTAGEWLEEHTGGPADEAAVIYEYRNDADPPERRGRWLTWRVALLVDADTYAEPEGTTWGLDVPPSKRPGFEWDVDALERAVSDRIDWPTGERGLQRVAVCEDHVVADIYDSGLGSPLGYARQVRRAVERYNHHTDETVRAAGGTVTRPDLELADEHYVGPIDTDAVDEWAAGLPDLDGEPVDPTPEPAPEPEPERSGGRLSGLLGRGR